MIKAITFLLLYSYILIALGITESFSRFVAR